ncbi:adenosylcobinamide-GDP ribazoletransferase [Erythrobacter sp. HL-111]|uniref:adenosylcobinamide-GDP ribazoletransferase n=1 Tax=Erythrobacter sp. HL-111 TaxID=1798193 RepID=UPI0006DB3C07|nr:adenosylcobinamide-GDP ribazoletransferase [Erythrobacter sp. HL-111]KPP94431.1 MAG: cobalamin 5'-phosphate synthase CobV [Erythrobacteraceae bacterium HL-111]SDS56527.1 cobalamin-5'-phosphate synthase [Erythrobacter sp. HL-111]
MLSRPLRSLAAAWIFLTRIPLPAMALEEEDFAAAPAFYPLVGLLVGAIGAAALAAGHALASPVIAALLALAATLLATGAFHEDGLADLFDGLGAATRERMMEVMRDSRLGTFGAAALGVALALKVAALAELPPALALAALPLAHGVSRLSAVLVIATSSYVRAAGLAKPVAQGIGRGALAAAIATGLGALGLFGLVAGGGAVLAAVAGCVVGHVAIRLLFERRLGGYTGDCLGAVQQASELGVYLALVAWL